MHVTSRRAPGCFTQIEYSFDLGGDKAATQNFEFSAEVEPLAFTIPRPLGIVFEERRVDGKYSYIRAEEVMEDSNADKAGVKVRCKLSPSRCHFMVAGRILRYVTHVCGVWVGTI